MKDLAGGASIHDLAQAGVASLKIEGRKKSPLYVAAAVHYHRKLLDRTFKAGEQEQCAHDLRTIFSRPWTGLYLQSKANRAVIDPDATGHRGTPVGRVENSGRDFIQFRTALPLEVHDGLQIELPGETRPFGFAVEEILLPNGRRVFEAPAGSVVQVPLPAEAPRIPNGTELFLASSQAVKRRYRFDIPNPRDLRRRFPMDVRLVLSETRAEAAATARGRWACPFRLRRARRPLLRRPQRRGHAGRAPNRLRQAGRHPLRAARIRPAKARRCSFPSRSSIPCAAI